MSSFHAPACQPPLPSVPLTMAGAQADWATCSSLRTQEPLAQLQIPVARRPSGRCAANGCARAEIDYIWCVIRASLLVAPRYIQLKKGLGCDKVRGKGHTHIRPQEQEAEETHRCGTHCSEPTASTLKGPASEVKPSTPAAIFRRPVSTNVHVSV